MGAVQVGDWFEFVEHTTIYNLAAFDTAENTLLSITPAGTDAIYYMLNVNVLMYNIQSKGTFRVYYTGKNNNDIIYKRQVVSTRLDSGEIYWDPTDLKPWVPIYFQHAMLGGIKITWQSIGGEPSPADIILKYVIGNRAINT